MTSNEKNRIQQEEFEHLFDDMDLSSSRLGRDVKSRSKLMAKILSSVSEILFLLDDVEIDILYINLEVLTNT